MQLFSVLARRLFGSKDNKIDIDNLPPAGFSPGPETKEALLADQEALARAAAELRYSPTINVGE